MAWKRLESGLEVARESGLEAPRETGLEAARKLLGDG